MTKKEVRTSKAILHVMAIVLSIIWLAIHSLHRIVPADQWQLQLVPIYHVGTILLPIVSLLSAVIYIVARRTSFGRWSTGVPYAWFTCLMMLSFLMKV